MRAYLFGGDTCVFQWDNHRRLILEGFPPGVVVAYSNECGKRAPVVESFAEDGAVYAKIPPEIMQEPHCIEADIRLDGNTLHKTFITLIPGNKPDDYVMEPVEILRYETLAKRIEALELSGGSGGSTIVDDGEGNITVSTGVADDGDGNITFA